MIFLTVGTQKFQFNRLLQAVDQLIEAGIIREPVIAQCGYSTYIPQNYETCMFMDNERFLQAVQDCDFLITHCGVGTILKGIEFKKRIIVVPRQKSFSEHVDDHQKEIAREFGKLGSVCACYQIADLEKCYRDIQKASFAEVQLHFSNTAKYVNDYLNDL